MSTNLTRLSEISTALQSTEHAARAVEIYRGAVQAAHAHPRQSSTVRNSFRRLHKLAQQAGIWDGLAKADNSPE